MNQALSNPAARQSDINCMISSAKTAFALDFCLSPSNTGKTSVFVCDSYLSASDLYKNISFFEKFLFPDGRSRQVFFCEEIIPVSFLYELRGGGSPVVILSPEAFFSRVPEPDSLLKSSISVRKGNAFPRDAFIETLISFGYERRNEIEGENEFAVRGEIIDIFNADSPYPVRMDFFDEIVENIKYFDINTQRSFKDIDSFTVFPVKSDFYEKKLNILDFVLNPLLYVEEPRTELNDLLKRGGGEILNRLSSDLKSFFYFNFQERQLRECANNASAAKVLPVLDIENGIPGFAQKFKYGDTGRLNLNRIKKVFSVLSGKNFNIAVLSRNEVHNDRIKAIFESAGILRGHILSRLKIITGDVSSGIISKKHRLLIVKDEELFREHLDFSQPARNGQSSGRDFFGGVEELNPGDLVVHDDFGIARFGEIKNKTVKGVSADYFTLIFEGGDKVFVPSDKIYLIHKYIASSETGDQQLSRLGNKTWEKAKAKAKKKVEEIAEDLKVLYAKRMAERGFAFSGEDETYREFEESFEFEETQDQSAAIRDVLEDMQNSKPMDRLICGDVGFGKTEVAVRAAFKAAMDGKQVVFIAPTTLLVDQHCNTFKKRFEKYPLKIACISRFAKPREAKEVAVNLNNGEIDIVIGTHKLLSDSFRFKDLGLLIIDEEQKFGAMQKEKIKKLRYSIDVLAMSATPIPRTLYLSMSGIRDLSIISTPPAGRKNVITEIVGYDDARIKDAVYKELSRGGQVYFIENRIMGMEGVYDRLKSNMPDVKIGIVHGRQEPDEIIEVMHAFYDKRYDLLLSTSIIESGLDNPNVNTIIINNAERFGLSQLYQLRGRVGRSHLQAYCLLATGSDVDGLSAEQKKRLSAVKEYSELSSGFKLAMADLEIRGAGNVLGGAQSGHIDAVGLEMCMQMLRDEIDKIKGTLLPEPVAPEVKTDVSSFIPDFYIADEKSKMSVYRKLSNCNEELDVDSVRMELLDRFGKIPESVENLLRITELKAFMRRTKVQAIEIKGGQISLEFHESAGTVFEGLVRFVNDRETSGEYIVNFSGEFGMRLRPKKNNPPQSELIAAKIVLQRLSAYVNI